jgi:mono/diheme cytochrome c family protein
MPRTIMPVIISCLALLWLGGFAHAQDPVRQGRLILKDFCADCHSIGKRGDSPQAGATPFRMLGRSFVLDQFARELERGLLAGHPNMPEFKLSSDDARAVSAYLRTIQQ